MSHEYKVSNSMKLTFVLALAVGTLAGLVGDDMGVGVAVITLVILSVSTEILEAIHNTTK